MALRVVRASAEVLGTAASGDALVTRVVAEVAGQSNPDLRVYRFAFQALVERLGSIDRSIDQTVTFGQSTSLAYKLSVGAAQSLVFGQTVADSLTLEPTLSQSLVFSQSAPEPGQTSTTVGSSNLIFSHSVENTPFDGAIAQSLVFSHTGETTSPTPYVETITHGLVFGHTLTLYAPNQNVQQSLIFGHTILKVGPIIPGGIVRSASDSLVFTHNAQRVWVKASATSHSATQSLIFTGKAALPLDFVLQQFTIFTDSAVGDYVWSMEQTVLFDHTESTAGTAWTRSESQGLVFNHAFVFDNADTSLCQYAPIVGENTIPEAIQPPSATPPTLTPSTTITLFYPTTSPTLTVQIRAPELGDRDRLQMLRINRESRGGTLQVFADQTWPKVQILALAFTGLTEAEAASIHNFFVQTLGLEVGLTDWEGRTWHGIIVTPEQPFIRSRRGIVDISFEFDGELQ